MKERLGDDLGDSIKHRAYPLYSQGLHRARHNNKEWREIEMFRTLDE